MEPPPYAAVHETHIGVVFLLGDRAYKLKKPVDLGFLDFSTPEKRRVACHREVELNRRLSPDVYLGVSEVSGVDGGEPADFLVVMRRMPQERRLATLVKSGEDVTHVVDRLARMVAVFHGGAERGEEISAQGSRDAIRGRWRDSFDQVRPLDVLDAGEAAEIERLTLDFLAGREPLFERRITEGRVLDGHGDLLTADIFCLDDGPRVLDCLEFDDRLRWLDGLDDIAFLAMDLERLGAPWLAERLLERYAEFAGDPAPASLRHHYVAYRAFVRAKVACLRATQGDADSAAEARDYARLALEHLRTGRPRLILVGGLPGTGKSTLAGGVADRLGAVLLASDRLRKELAGRSPHEHAAAGYQGGIYAPSTASAPTLSCCTGRGSCWRRASRWCWTRRGCARATGPGRPRPRGPSTANSSRCAARHRPRWPPGASAPATAGSPTPTRESPRRCRPTPTCGRRPRPWTPRPRRRSPWPRPCACSARERGYRGTSSTHTRPGASGTCWPEGLVNVVPCRAVGRDHVTG
ncbi:aminoglycoside phosphotransferase family enzyme [Prauserella muralis]|nr:aminoglycoside phosphotransferase family enzyme [Prauserella muralis]